MIATHLSPFEDDEVPELAEYLSREDERALILRSQAGDSEATALLLDNLAGLLHKMSRRWFNVMRGRFEYEDCFQEAVGGAMRAIEKFEVSRDLKLITYATWWIQQRLSIMREKMDVVRVPLYRKSWDRSRSLNVPLGPGNEADRQSLLASDLEDDDVFRQLEKRDASAIAESLLKCLTTRHKRIIRLRYAGFSLEEVGEKLGITRERVRQLESKALLRLKLEADRRGLKDDGGRECTTRRTYECTKCGSYDTAWSDETVAERKRWRCRDCKGTFIPEELRHKPIELKPPEHGKPEKFMRVLLAGSKGASGPIKKERTIRMEPVIRTNTEVAEGDVESKVVELLKAGECDKEISRRTELHPKTVNARRVKYEAEHGPVNCPCGRLAVHRGGCSHREKNKAAREGQAAATTLRTVAKKPKKPAAPSTVVIRSKPEAAMAVPAPAAPSVTTFAEHLRQQADDMEAEADKLRSKAADLREAARLVAKVLT